ncbi:Protein RST1 [Bienertia sinuspersici]
MDAYNSLLARTQVPQPSLQRFAVIQIFQKLSSSTYNLNSDLNAERAPLHNVFILLPLLWLINQRASCDSRFVNVFVKGIGFLVRFGFHNGSSVSKNFFDAPENHPFVKVLTCRSEAHNELVQQVVLFVVHCKQCGISEVCNYLRPLLTFSVVQACSSVSSLSSFLSRVIYSLMSICCSLLHEANPLLEMLIGCLSCFNLKGVEDVGKVVIFAEFLVDAYTIVLGHSVKMGLMVNEVQSVGEKLLDALLTLCLEFEKRGIVSKPVLELSRRLLIFEKDLGLYYAPQIFYTMLLLVVLLARLELEDEKLSVLDLLTLLLRNEARVAFNLSEMSLFFFPVISLLSSPSKAVKSAASQFLVMLEKLLGSHSTTSRDEQFVRRGSLFVTKPEMIIFRLLQHLWHEELSPCSFYLTTYSASVNDNVMEGGASGSKSWISQLGKYALLVAERQKSCGSISSSQEVMSTEIPFLLGALVGSLVVHQSLGVML